MSRDSSISEGMDPKAFVALFIFSLLYLFPILLADFYYIDDLGRSLSGYTNWRGNGRPLADLLAIILSDGKPLMDISPWSQILSVGVLDFSLLFFVRRYLCKASYWHVLFVSGFGYLNLFMLENLSYKYDCLGMVVSLSIFLILYGWSNELSNKQCICISSILVVITSLSLYQASIGAYSWYCFLRGCCCFVLFSFCPCSVHQYSPPVSCFL